MSSKDVHIRRLKDGCDITASGRYIFMSEGKRAEVIIEECQQQMRESTLLSALRTTIHANMSSLLKSLWLVRILL